MGTIARKPHDCGRPGGVKGLELKLPRGHVPSADVTGSWGSSWGCRWLPRDWTPPGPPSPARSAPSRLSPCPAPSTQRPAHGPETCTQTHTPELTTSGAPGASHPNHTAAPAGEAHPGRLRVAGGRWEPCAPRGSGRGQRTKPHSPRRRPPSGLESHSHFQGRFPSVAAPPSKASLSAFLPGLHLHKHLEAGAARWGPGPPTASLQAPFPLPVPRRLLGKQKETRPGWPGRAGQGHWASLAVRCPRWETRPLACAPSAARGRHAGWTRSPRHTWASSHGSGREAE